MSTAFSITSGGAFAVASTGKTLLNVIAGSTNPPIITEFSVSFDGVTSNAVPALVELCSSTQGAAGTTGTIGTAKMIRGYPSFTPVTTVSGQYSAEPTTLTAIKQWYVPAFMGLLVVQWPLGREAQGQISASTDMKAVAIRVSAPAAVNARGYVEWEE